MKKDIKSLLPEELEAELRTMGQPAYRAKQVFKWLFSGVEGFGEMTNIPRSLREKLDGEFFITRPGVLNCQTSKLDGTIKYLWEIPVGAVGRQQR